MSKQKHKSAWRVWALALGEKASPCDKESDRVAILRSIIFLTYLLTNIFIIAGVIRHWNDIDYDKNQPTTGDIRSLRRGVYGEETTLGDICLLRTEGRSDTYHISDAGELRCRY